MVRALTDAERHKLHDDVQAVMAALGAEPITLVVGEHAFVQVALPWKRLVRLLAYGCLGHSLVHADPHAGPHPDLAHLVNLASKAPLQDDLPEVLR